MRPIQSGLRRSTAKVLTSARPGGMSRRVETSKSPKTVIATVRGIGVAVITNWWAVASPRLRSTSRCSTPNRCCSSTTTRPRSWNWTCSLRRAWVPTTIPASPDAARASAAVRWRAVSDDVTSSTWVAWSAPPSMPGIASGPSIPTMERWCWCASTSVGASSAACPPLSTTCSIARRATRVFPLPTSPCRSRCIGVGLARSAAISSPTRR